MGMFMSNTAESPEHCPLCDKPAAPAYAPFCSRLCQDRDLRNWLNEGYRVPGPPQDTLEDPSA